MTGADVPTSSLREWMTTLSNWDRWGADDQRGTLNLITPERIAEVASRSIRGHAVSCAKAIPAATSTHVRLPAAEVKIPLLIVDGAYAHRFVLEEADAPSEDGAGGDAHRTMSADGFLIVPHGLGITHLDAPCHTQYDGSIYNGHTAGEAGGVDVARNGIATRGVLLDLTLDPSADNAEQVEPEDFERVERLESVQVGAGDALLVRFGHRREPADGARTWPQGTGPTLPGLGPRCLPWLRERDVSVLATDTLADPYPCRYPDFGLPIHTVGIAAMGLWLVDACNFEDLARESSSSMRWDFLFVIGPLVLPGGTGSPVNPLAIF